MTGCGKVVFFCIAMALLLWIGSVVVLLAANGAWW